MRPRRVLIIIGVLVVAVMAVGTALTLRGDPLSGHPPRLALAAEPVHTRPKATPTPSSRAKPSASCGVGFGHRPGPPEAAGPRVCPRVEAEGSLPCTPKASVVTGARAGLSLTFDRNAPLLAPSWLFTTTASEQPIPQVAIVPDHLAGPGP